MNLIKIILTGMLTLLLLCASLLLILLALSWITAESGIFQQTLDYLLSRIDIMSYISAILLLIVLYVMLMYASYLKEKKK